MRLIHLGFILALAWTAQAGTTVIHVDTEDGGDVTSVDGTVVNRKGALFWNGAHWVTNDTAAHMFFTDLRTGERLQNYTTVIVQGNTPGPVTTVFADVPIVRSLYTYQKNIPGGSLRVNGVQYRITGSFGTVVLRSRAAAAGSTAAYFDIYAEAPGGTGTLAMRGDPVWFSYPMGLDQAMAQSSAADYRSGNLPTVGANYFLDMNGGSDMGGVTYKFRTGSLAGAGPGLGSSFPVQFSYMWFPLDAELRELRFLPSAEGVFAAGDPAPSGVPAATPPALVTMLLGLAGMGLHQLRKRKAAGQL